MLPYLDLLRVGFGQPACRQTAGALLPHLFTIAGLQRNTGDVGCIVSAPLSVGLPRLPVRKHPALWSSDFPPRQLDAAAVRPAH